MSENLVLVAALGAIGLAIVAAVGVLNRARRRPAGSGDCHNPTVNPSEDPSLRLMHELTPEQFQRVCWLHAALAEANPISFDEWIAALEANSEVEREIRLLEAVATTYSRATGTAILSS